MTLNLIDELTETRGSGNRECVAQELRTLLTAYLAVWVDVQ